MESAIEIAWASYIADMRIVDYLTIAAIILGPVMAVVIQLGFERRREKRKAQFNVLSSLMAYRGRLIHPESVSALNLVTLVFYDSSEVIAKHAELMAHMERERTLPEDERVGGWQKRDDLTVELITHMAEVLGYRFSHSGIKTTRYLPQGYLNEDEFTMKARAGLLSLLNGEQPLLVRLAEDETRNSKNDT